MSSEHKSVANTNLMALLQCMLPVKADADPAPLAAVVLKTAPCLGFLPPAVRRALGSHHARERGRGRAGACLPNRNRREKNQSAMAK